MSAITGRPRHLCSTAGAFFTRSVDERDGTVYAAANHLVYGPTVQRSTDGGKTWRRSQQIGLPEQSGLTVNATWYIEPGRPGEPGILYLGGDPAFLSRSDDGGETCQGSLRMAAGLHRDFVRMALDNALATPGGMRVVGSDVDLGKVDLYAYIVAGSNDHIVRWRNAYRSTQLLGGESRFVLSTSGTSRRSSIHRAPKVAQASGSRSRIPQTSRNGRRRRSRTGAAGGRTTSPGSSRARASSCRLRRSPGAALTRRWPRRLGPT
jgi:hypothetical protein